MNSCKKRLIRIANKNSSVNYSGRQLSQPTDTDSQPTVTDSQPTVTDSQPTVTDSQPTVTDSQPTVTDSQLTDTDSQPTVTDSQPTVTNSQPTDIDSQPTVTDSQPSVTDSQLSDTDSQPTDTYFNLPSRIRNLPTPISTYRHWFATYFWKLLQNSSTNLDIRNHIADTRHLFWILIADHGHSSPILNIKIIYFPFLRRSVINANH